MWCPGKKKSPVVTHTHTQNTKGNYQNPLKVSQLFTFCFFFLSFVFKGKVKTREISHYFDPQVKSTMYLRDIFSSVYSLSYYRSTATTKIRVCHYTACDHRASFFFPYEIPFFNVGIFRTTDVFFFFFPF